ncbi:glycosyltransferase family 2 protein [Qipengyuania atrilutea]|uniref:Glycosyltransferase family 2 protein n=1 Tax=Qipengyuania atrilutea TaxID=2744473 RepID=A0A850H222_9SPHN|nr:glycosyltransferase family 2 protein [Actirhodobacter atriluteus]NVD43968.1 glycosyltransferase family 2 protein [Actirhodobacter atriluteus]
MRPNLTAAICTYKRNEPLALLLNRLGELADNDRELYALGVVVVDDSADQQARDLVMSFANRFERGIEYRHSGKRNISIARNLVLQTAADGGADWIAMTDDDCEPSDEWLSELLRVQREYDADIVTGPLFRRAPDDAPNWLKTQPFLNLANLEAPTGTILDSAFTNNSMIPASIFSDRQDLRFDPEFGRIGGEDMVFYRQVAKEGYRIVFAANAKVFENEDENRLTFPYQLRRHFWMGNSSVRTMLNEGSSNIRMVVHSTGTAVRALSRPFIRTLKGERPQWFYCAAQLSEAAGKYLGVLGVKVKHK